MTPNLSPHDCPRCRVKLHVGQVAGVILHGCGHCGGIWLATACARRIAEALPPEAIGMAARASHAARRVVDTSAPAACPVCSRAMNRIHAAAARVDLDTCPAHGTWYDRHELEQIARVLGASKWRTAGVGAAGVGVAAGVGMAAGAGMAVGAGMAGQSQMQAQAQAQAASGVDGAGVALDVGEVVVETGAEVGVEIGFGIVGDILGGIFDGL